MFLAKGDVSSHHPSKSTKVLNSQLETTRVSVWHAVEEYPLIRSLFLVAHML